MEKLIHQKFRKICFRPLSLTILTAGIGITMFLVDAIFLKPKTSSQALNDFEKNFLICSDYNKISIYYIKRF